MKGWTSALELLALAIEEIGLLAADKRREEPIAIVRPERSQTPGRRRSNRTMRQPSSAPPAAAPRMTGHRAMLAAAMQRGMIRRG
ncbi:hypothetical protein [Streptomyces sp. BH055]|uniref:hypothetical protein n=1 Tax=unclassified Streptomyces TaxID=2593676 RepID=UPI003BB6FE14